MARIRSRGNKSTELALAKIFRANGITGWRRGRKLRLLESGVGRSDAGERSIIRPDFVFLKNKVAVFVDGDFWHGHPTRAKIPKTRRAWWLAKIEGNKARDRRQNRLLRKNGWKVVRIWQHELERKHVQKALRKLRAAGLLEGFGEVGADGAAPSSYFGRVLRPWGGRFWISNWDKRSLRGCMRSRLAV